MDPLHVLRCDPAILRCAVTLEIVLHMLRALLAASRTQLSLHLSENCAPDAASAADRDELRVALVAAQESAAVQILLEVHATFYLILSRCLPFRTFSFFVIYYLCHLC